LAKQEKKAVFLRIVPAEDTDNRRIRLADEIKTRLKERTAVETTTLIMNINPWLKMLSVRQVPSQLYRTNSSCINALSGSITSGYSRQMRKMTAAVDRSFEQRTDEGDSSFGVTTFGCRRDSGSGDLHDILL
jgi:hypothetical protein